QMQRIDGIVADTVQKVKGLDKQSGDISKLVQVIKDIAEQTNLLALNAAIEATRAGEHGKGFAVVASKVRSLAEQVAASVTEITDIVGNIQTETNHVLEALNTGYDEVEKGTAQIKETGSNFETINIAVSGMAQKITAISGNLKGIADKNSHMKDRKSTRLNSSHVSISYAVF